MLRIGDGTDRQPVHALENFSVPVLVGPNAVVPYLLALFLEDLLTLSILAEWIVIALFTIYMHPEVFQLRDS